MKFLLKGHLYNVFNIKNKTLDAIYDQKLYNK